MSRLTLREEWIEPGYVPATIAESPFEELECDAERYGVLEHLGSAETEESLEAYAATLVANLARQLFWIQRPVHLLLSGGYDSRILAAILERLELEPLCVTDGGEEPVTSHAMDVLGIPEERRYVHDLSQPDPYGLADARCSGFAQLYQQFRFAPADPKATLVTGIGGEAWHYYPAADWLRGKPRRLPGDDLVAMWLDCWQQYTLIPEAWARGYRAALHPYCTPAYAADAARCRREWLELSTPSLDLVREAMLSVLDERLLEPGWYGPRVYDWGLTEEQASAIDERYWSSRLAQTHHREEFGWPSEMDRADHACKLAGFATWIEELELAGHEVIL